MGFLCKFGECIHLVFDLGPSSPTLTNFRSLIGFKGLVSGFQYCGLVFVRRIMV